MKSSENQPARDSRPENAGPGTAGAGPAEKAGGRTLSVSRALPLLVIVAAIVAFFAFGLDSYLTFEQLSKNRAALNSWVDNNGIIAALLFMLGYIAVVALSLPVASLATLVAGFLFGIVGGSIVVVIGATIGAVILFLAARYAFGDYLRTKTGGAIKKMEEGFREDAFSYLLVLRLVPLFPFFIVNLVPAFLGVSTRVFTLATFIGIIPGSVVYVSVGNGLGAVFDRGEKPDFGIIFQPEILLPILGLAVLALIPVAYKRIRRRRTGAAGN